MVIKHTFTSSGVLLGSALALGALHCGGSSNRDSNMPEASSTDPYAEVAPTPGTGLGQAPEEPSTSGPDTTGSRPFEQGPNSPQGTDSSLASASQLNDQQIALITQNVNTAEIEQARVAQAKSQSEQVRRFAEMMIEHHGRAKTQQQALGLPTAESPLSQELERKAQSTLQKLNAKTGDDFDRAYIQAQVEGHQEALDTIRQLKANAKSSELRSYLDNLAPQVEHHLEQARSAQRELQSRANSSSTSGATGMR